MEQMLIELLDTLSTQTASTRQYDDLEKVCGGELSKEARRELYLKYQDKGYER